SSSTTASSSSSTSDCTRVWSSTLISCAISTNAPPTGASAPGPTESSTLELSHDARTGPATLNAHNNANNTNRAARIGECRPVAPEHTRGEHTESFVTQHYTCTEHEQMSAGEPYSTRARW